MDEEKRPKLSLANYEFNMASSDFESELEDAGFVMGRNYSKFWMDDYDNSVEFGKVDDDFRMSEAQQRVVHDHGFAKAYVNHKDGWETHYNWHGRDFILSRGWRRRYVIDPKSDTTRVMGGSEDRSDNGYYEISYWPDTWSTVREWLTSGYMRLVPDPLDPLSRS